MTAPTAARRSVLNRESELAVVEESAGRNRSVLLTGPPGVGRTRLLQETLRRLCPPDAPGTSDRPVTAHHELPGLLKRGVTAGPPGSRSRRPAVLGVDDIHRLAAAVAAPLAEAVREGRIRLLATAPTGPALPAAVDGLARDGLLCPVEVAPFDRAGVARTLRARLGGQVDSGTAARFWELTGGNPLLLTELTDWAVGGGSLRPSRGLWRWEEPSGRPVRLDATARRLLGTLDPDEEHLVAALSLAGPVPDDLPVVGDLGPAAERLNRRGIVVAEPADHGLRLRLGQPLSGHAVVAGLPALTARRLRLRLADELAPGHGAAGTSADAWLLRAVCLRLDAGRRPAAGALLDAAEVALLGREYATAERLVRAALAGGAGDDRAPEGPVALLLGRALAGQGRGREAETLLAAADDGTPDATAARVENLARGLGGTREAAGITDRAVRRTPRGSVRGTQSAVRLWQDRLDEVARAGDTLPRESCTAPALQACVPLSAFARTELGDAPAASATLERCPVEGWQDDARHAHRVVSAHVALETGDLATARDAVERLRRADPAHDVRRRLRADVLGARLLRTTGRAPEAVALLRRAASAPDGPDWFTTRAWILAQLAGALAESGRRTEAVRTLIEVREAARDVPPTRSPMTGPASRRHLSSAGRETARAP